MALTKAQQVCDFWLRVHKPQLGYDRKTRQVLPKARGNPLYRANLEVIEERLASGFTQVQLERYMRIARDAGAVDHVGEVLPKVVPPEIPEGSRYHPFFYGDDGVVVKRTAEQLLGYILRKIEDPHPRDSQMQALRYIFRVLKNPDLVLYAADAAVDLGEESVNGLYGILRFRRAAEERLEQKRQILLGVEEDLRCRLPS